MKKNINVTIMNLGNYNTYDLKVNGFKDLQNQASDLIKNNDYEVQDVFNCDLKLNASNVIDYLFLMDYLEEKAIDFDSDDIAYLLERFDINDVIAIYENDYFFIKLEGNNKTDVIERYIYEYDLFPIPDHLVNYIDYNAILRDFECGGVNIYEVKPCLYMIVEPF